MFRTTRIIHPGPCKRCPLAARKTLHRRVVRNGKSYWKLIGTFCEPCAEAYMEAAERRAIADAGLSTSR